MAGDILERRKKTQQLCGKSGQDREIWGRSLKRWNTTMKEKTQYLLYLLVNVLRGYFQLNLRVLEGISDVYVESETTEKLR